MAQPPRQPPRQPHHQRPRLSRSPRSSAHVRPATTGQLIAWAFYDWANSAYATLIHTFIFAAYFMRRVAENESTGTAQWGMTVGAAGLAVAVAGPVLGAIADQGGRRKPWVAALTGICVVATALMWFVEPEVSDVMLALLLVGIGTACMEASLIFYNAMLPGLAPAGRLGRWSGWAWGLGFIGGLSCLAIALFAFLGVGTGGPEAEDPAAMRVRGVFPFVAAWYALFALPMLLFTPDAPGTGKRPGRAMRDGLRQLRDSVRDIRQYAPIVRFLIARMFYIDALATIFAFAGVYAAGTFGMDERQVVIFGIGVNVTAAIGAIGFAWIDDWLGGRRTILISLAGLTLTTGGLLLIDSHAWLWTLGLGLGLFVGPVQAASRSYMGRVAPEHLRTQMFGLFALSAKATAFAGPLLVAVLTGLGASQRAAMSVIVALFLIGLGLMWTVPRDAPRGQHAASPAANERRR